MILLTFILIAFALHAQYCYDHDNNNYRGRCQSDHKPRPSVKGPVLQIAIFQIELRRSHYNLIAAGRIADAVHVICDNSEGICSGWQQALVGYRKLFQYSITCSSDRLPSCVIYEIINNRFFKNFNGRKFCYLFVG